MATFMPIPVVTIYLYLKHRKKDGKYQGPIKSSTTHDPGYHMGK